jgi:hypothetical protein
MFLTDQADPDIAALELRHRQPARVEDRSAPPRPPGCATCPLTDGDATPSGSRSHEDFLVAYLQVEQATALLAGMVASASAPAAARLLDGRDAGQPTVSLHPPVQKTIRVRQKAMLADPGYGRVL